MHGVTNMCRLYDVAPALTERTTFGPTKMYGIMIIDARKIPSMIEPHRFLLLCRLSRLSPIEPVLPNVFRAVSTPIFLCACTLQQSSSACTTILCSLDCQKKIPFHHHVSVVHDDPRGPSGCQGSDPPDRGERTATHATTMLGSVGGKIMRSPSGRTAASTARARVAPGVRPVGRTSSRRSSTSATAGETTAEGAGEAGGESSRARGAYKVRVCSEEWGDKERS